MGKRYTFEGLESLVNEHLNADGQVALLYYNNGRVTWRVFPKVKPPTNSKISAGMVNFLRPSKIELSAGLKELLNFLACDQADDTYVNEKPTKTIAVIPIVSATPTGNKVAKRNPSHRFADRENYDRKLNFRLQDENSNELPVKQMIAHFTIND